MIRYLAGRAAQAAAVLLVMSFVVHGLIGLMPGDPIDLMITADPKLTAEDAARLRALHGLDRPLIERYGNWLAAAVHGDFGFSRLHAKPVLAVMGPALGNTVALMGGAFLLAVTAGVGLGILAATRQGRATDHAVNLLAFAGISLPTFWLGLLLILLFAVHWGLLPAGGMPTGEAGPAVWLRHLILPIATLFIANLGPHARYARAAMIEALGQDHIRTARAIGASETRVVFGHALRNALLPVVTVIALEFGALFSGALITETIFAWPGMGRLIYDAIMGNDFNLALMAVLFATLLTLIGSLLADLAYAALDPRIRLAAEDAP